MNKLLDVVNNLNDDNMVRYIVLCIGIILVLALIGYVVSNIETKKRLNKQ